MNATLEWEIDVYELDFDPGFNESFTHLALFNRMNKISVEFEYVLMPTIDGYCMIMYETPIGSYFQHLLIPFDTGVWIILSGTIFLLLLVNRLFNHHLPQDIVIAYFFGLNIPEHQMKIVESVLAGGFPPPNFLPNNRLRSVFRRLAAASRRLEFGVIGPEQQKNHDVIITEEFPQNSIATPGNVKLDPEIEVNESFEESKLESGNFEEGELELEEKSVQPTALEQDVALIESTLFGNLVLGSESENLDQPNTELEPIS
ncbi:conserved hypothetical protein [Culex quinquefasciatus]|uniref:Uncharacterized protein n=1 Tax=Culex quinquefasciatus TaxID=7176 RepID=B0XCG9_CULQU|nr:conserved hypothetical protein [Culex quinquefasciatus]|eukprot:XP_001867341.1 conserved hypothetical protein [Culex quinquefasciatus]